MHALQILTVLAEKVISCFPDDPFTDFLDTFSDLPFLSYLNWFLPVKDILIVFAVWLGAVGSYYAYSFIARHIKIIGGGE